MFDEPAPPIGDGPQEIWNRQLMRWIRNHLVLSITNAKRKPQSTGGVIYEVPPQVSLSSGGIRWQAPDKELDPTKAVGQNTLVYISPDSPLVLVGITDLISGANAKAQSGTWLATRNVPAQAMVSGTLKYNVPQTPYPGSSGTPSGTPLAGDVDGANVFWVLISGAASVALGEQVFVITSLSNADYLICYPWSFVPATSMLSATFVLGTTPIYVAKDPRFRPSVTSENVDGVPITFSGYTADNQRSATDGTNTEIELVYPRYVTIDGEGLIPVTSLNCTKVNISRCRIVATQPAGGTGLRDPGGNLILWEEIKPARVWNRPYGT